MKLEQTSKKHEHSPELQGIMKRLPRKLVYGGIGIILLILGLSIGIVCYFGIV